VVARKAVKREQVAVLEVDRARVLVGDVHVRGRRGEYKLNSRNDPLDSPEQRPDERPFDVGSEGPDCSTVPTVGSAINGDGRLLGTVGMIEVAATVGGENHLLAPRGKLPQIPAQARERALGILPLDTRDGEAVGLQLQVPAGDVVKAEARINRR